MERECKFPSSLARAPPDMEPEAVITYALEPNMSKDSIRDVIEYLDRIGAVETPIISWRDRPSFVIRRPQHIRVGKRGSKMLDSALNLNQSSGVSAFLAECKRGGIPICDGSVQGVQSFVRRIQGQARSRGKDKGRVTILEHHNLPLAQHVHRKPHGRMGFGAAASAHVASSVSAGVGVRSALGSLGRVRIDVRARDYRSGSYAHSRSHQSRSRSRSHPRNPASVIKDSEGLHRPDVLEYGIVGGDGHAEQPPRVNWNAEATASALYWPAGTACPPPYVPDNGVRMWHVDKVAEKHWRALAEMDEDERKREHDNLMDEAREESQARYLRHRDRQRDRAKPGYCENCHCRYDNLNEHVESDAHMAALRSVDTTGVAEFAEYVRAQAAKAKRQRTGGNNWRRAAAAQKSGVSFGGISRLLADEEEQEAKAEAEAQAERERLEAEAKVKAAEAEAEAEVERQRLAEEATAQVKAKAEASERMERREKEKEAMAEAKGKVESESEARERAIDKAFASGIPADRIRWCCPDPGCDRSWSMKGGRWKHAAIKHLKECGHFHIHVHSEPEPDFEVEVDFESGSDSGEVKCTCGGADEEAAISICCDKCETWYHTVCCPGPVALNRHGTVRGDFVCHECKAKAKAAGDGEVEAAVADAEVDPEARERAIDKAFASGIPADRIRWCCPDPGCDRSWSMKGGRWKHAATKHLKECGHFHVHVHSEPEPAAPSQPLSQMQEKKKRKLTTPKSIPVSEIIPQSAASSVVAGVGVADSDVGAGPGAGAGAGVRMDMDMEPPLWLSPPRLKRKARGRSTLF